MSKFTLAFIFNVQGCEILEAISDGSDIAYWEYLINATELVRAAINDNETKALEYILSKQFDASVFKQS